MQLILDTSGKQALVLLMQNHKTIGSALSTISVAHSESLLPLIDDVFNSAKKNPNDLTHIGVCVGPGSFTGLRIGISTAKALAQGLQVPIMPFSSLQIFCKMAELENSLQKQIPIAVVPAYQGEVFWGGYLAGQWNEGVLSPKKLLSHLYEVLGDKSELMFIGSGALFVEESLKMETITTNPTYLQKETFEQQSLACFLKSSSQKIHYSNVQANYMRSSSAEQKLASILAH